MGKVLSVGLVLVLCVSAGAYADMVSPGVNFGGGGDSLTASLTATGTATVGGSGSYYYWVGWPGEFWTEVTISFDNQNVGLGTNPDTINVSKDPTGTGQVSFERLFQTLDDRSQDDLVVDLLGGSPQNLALDRITLEGTAIGFVDVEVHLDAYGSITQLGFDQTGGATIGGDGQFPVASSVVIATGDATAGYTVGVDGELEIPGLLTVDLGTLVDLSGTESLTGLPLPGTLTLEEIGTEGVYPKDVTYHLGGGLDEAIDVPFTTSGSESINTYAGNHDAYYKVNFNYNFDGNLSIDNISFDLYDTINGIIPEPTTVAVLGLGGALLSLSRRRRK